MRHQTTPPGTVVAIFHFYETALREAYLSKGSRIEDTLGRKCLCNALMTDAGYAQVQKGGYVEDSLMTSGDSLNDIAAWPLGYRAEDVVEFLLGRYVPGDKL